MPIHHPDMDHWSTTFPSSIKDLDFPSIFLPITFCLVISYLAWKALRPAKTPLPPGPRPLPVVGNLPFLDPELHTHFAALSLLHGPIFKLRLGSKLCVVISSPSGARSVLKDNDVIFANRDVPAVTKTVAYGGQDIVFTPYGPEWRMLRKVCVVKMLSNNTLDSVYALRRKEVRRAVRGLYERAGTEVDIGEWMFMMIMNVVTSMLWGETLKGDEREGIRLEFRDVVGEITTLLAMPNLSDFFPILRRFDLQGVEKRMKRSVEKLDHVFEWVIEKRLKLNKDHVGSGDRLKNEKTQGEDFLQFLIRLKDEEEDPKTPLTVFKIKALLTDMVVGGTDTTSNSIELTLAEIFNRPSIVRKIQEELDVVVGKGGIVEESHINKLPYLLAVMKESLRLHPVLPLLVPHCPSKTCTIEGYTVPKGSRVFVNVWAIHRDPMIWENPNEFNPDRFLDGKGDYSGNDFCYFPFGAGRRICAGIAMAERMVMYSLATLMHSFNWGLPGGREVDVMEKFGIVLKKKTPLIAIPSPRLSDPNLYD
ncbi:hypothetical protein MLD38_010925 [Melastoma candidum]|uniref:Uncharacterized protein n=1 Tax=Melastoma candidum TaxID=119954 RepID=A0ACB9R4H4_9MYRT|nr:hypothetical protein MLD38_010925 [Melastoma candidum]